MVRRLNIEISGEDAVEEKTSLIVKIIPTLFRLQQADLSRFYQRMMVGQDPESFHGYVLPDLRLLVREG
jgi:hypothetical protein